MANTGLNISGIYKIESKVHPERIYIGSSINMRKRRTGHFLALEKKAHKNPKLQDHYNKYGVEDLVFSVLAICDSKELIPVDNVVWLEQFFLDAYKPWFNILKVAGSSRGSKRSEEAKAKQRGKSPSEESKEKNRQAHLGKIPWNKGLKGAVKMPKESLEKRSLKMKGKKRPPFSQEWLNNLSEGHKGVKQSEESKRKKSDKLLGVKKDFWAIQNQMESYQLGLLIKKMEAENKVA